MQLMMRQLVERSGQLAGLLAVVVVVGLLTWSIAKAEEVSKPAIHVAMLTYDHGKTAQCFSSGFLADVARQTTIQVDRTFSQVSLDPEKLSAYPFLIMTGQGAFSLNEADQKVLKNYLQRGGFLLASPGCTSGDWNQSFRQLMKQLFPDNLLKTLAMEHPIFQMIYRIKDLAGRQAGTTGELSGMMLDGRLVVVYSDMGLNDTPNAGGGCCCCGGNELREAQRMNANILAYALTH